MAFADLLINTCTIRRYTDIGMDDYGNPIKDWTDHLPNQACRLMVGAGREVKVGAEVVIADYKLFVRDILITEQDRVIIDDVTYEVLLVSPRQDATEKHHKVCHMRTVR